MADSVPPVGLSRDRYHRYSWRESEDAPPRALPGVTSVLKVQDATGGTDGLMRWGAGLAVDYILSGPGRDIDDVEKARQLALDAMKGPANTGTDVHWAVEQVNLGLPLELTSVTASYIGHYAAFLAKHRPEFLAAEEMVANLTLGYAGQFDFIAKLDGRTALFDVKTGKAKASHRLQLAAYLGAEFRAGPGSTERRPMPKVQDAYVLFLRPDGFELERHVITKADRKHFAFLAQTYHRLGDWKPEEAA